MVSGQTQSLASNLFKVPESVPPELYLYYLEGKRKLAKVGFNGLYAELGRPYTLNEHQSVEMALGGMDYINRYVRFSSSDMPRIGTYQKDINLEGIVYGSEAIIYNPYLVYVVCMKSVFPINEDNIVKTILTSQNLLTVKLGEKIKAHAYLKNKESGYELPYIKREVPVLEH